MKFIKLPFYCFMFQLFAAFLLPLPLLVGCGNKEAKTEKLQSEIQQKNAEIAVAQKTYDDTKEKRKDDWRLSSDAQALNAKIETLNAEKAALSNQLQPQLAQAAQETQERRAEAQQQLAQQHNLPPPDAALQECIKTNHETLLALFEYSWAGKNSAGERIDFKAGATTLGGGSYGAQTVELTGADGKPILEVYFLRGALNENTFRLDVEETNHTSEVFGAFVATNKLVISFPEWTLFGNVEFAPAKKEFTHDINFHFGY